VIALAAVVVLLCALLAVMGFSAREILRLQIELARAHGDALATRAHLMRATALVEEGRELLLRARDEHRGCTCQVIPLLVAQTGNVNLSRLVPIRPDRDALEACVEQWRN
jgi:hypothetical protein